jgi:16S rRNA processing protein RimM
MQNSENFRIASIIKTHGVHGELILESGFHDLLEHIGESVLLELEGLLVPFFINAIVATSKERYRVKFDWVDTEAKAKKLVQAPVFSESAWLELSTESLQESPEMLVGFKIYDKITGLLGQVEAFIDNSSNPLLEISTPKGEMLIPFHTHFVHSINVKLKQITVDLPEGLLDLYL